MNAINKTDPEHESSLAEASINRSSVSSSKANSAPLGASEFSSGFRTHQTRKELRNSSKSIDAQSSQQNLGARQQQELLEELRARRAGNEVAKHTRISVLTSRARGKDIISFLLEILAKALENLHAKLFGLAILNRRKSSSKSTEKNSKSEKGQSKQDPPNPARS